MSFKSLSKTKSCGHLPERECPRNRGSHLFFTIKLTLLLVVASLQINAAAFSQQITVVEKDASLVKVLRQIGKQSGYQLLYKTEALQLANPVTVNVKQASLEEALQVVLKGQPFTYELLEKTILLKLKEPLTSTSAQTDTLVTGQVRLGGKNGTEVAPGVSIMEKGTTNGTQTDSDGRFSIRVQKNGTLVFSMIGYKRQEVSVAATPSFNIVLEEDYTSLDQVVVTGYAVQEKRAITGSIVSVQGADIENIPVQSFDKALQGKAAGVLVQSATGVPGGAVRINIRGVGSITAGTEPLYIVDGVQLNSSASTSRTSTNPLAYINSNDVESIEILKDAAAASIYGAQAANGVVLITTKKGRSGKTNLTLNYYQGVSAPTRILDVLNTQQALAMRMEAVKNANPTQADAVIRAGVLQEYGLFPDLSDEEIARLPTYDWQREAFKNGKVQNVELSASGGNEKTTFYVSGAYNDHEGNVTGIDYKKGNAKVRLGHQASKRLSFDLGINLSIITQNGNTGSQGNTTGSASPQYTAVFMPPTVPIYNEDGSFNAYSGMPGTGFNPIQAATVDDNIIRHRSVVGNFSATYKILENLSFKSFYGLDYRAIRTDYYRDPRTPNGENVKGYLIVENIENMNFTSNQTLNYNTSFGEDHSFSGLLGAEYRSDVQEYTSARGQGFPTHEYRTLQSAAEAVTVTGSWSGFRRLGFYTQANYDFRKKYFISGTLRYDGSSRFGADNRMGLFPAISAGWDIAQESFMQDVPWVEQLKLRVGYGQTGNDQINNVSSRGFYQGGGDYNANAGVRLLTIANPNLGWERNVTTNIGVDYSLLDRRIYGSVEVFHRASRDLLINRPLPFISGFSSIDDNVGELVNKGLELELNTDNIRSDHFNWSTSFNIAFIKNEVTELYDGLESISNTIRVGYPLNIYYRPRYAGVNSANGRPMWYDVNGNITYLPTAADNVPSRESWLSDYFGGLTNTFSYKGFELNTLFHFDMGRTLVNQMNATLAATNGNNAARNTVLRYYENRWTTPGQLTTVPRVIDGGAEANSASQQTASTRFLEDASFIRLREVTLSYNFSQPLVERIKLSRARVYVTGVNLHTWTKWTGYDPEIGLGGSVANNQGVVPQTMSVIAGFQIGF